MGWTTQISAAIIRDLIKSNENTMMPREWALVWAKRIEAQRAQLAVINGLSEVKNFDIIWQKDDGKHIETKLAKPLKMPTGRRCKYCGISHKPRQCPAYGKKCERCYKMNHFKEMNRSYKTSEVHTMQKEADQEKETDIEIVNINSV